MCQPFGPSTHQARHPLFDFVENVLATLLRINIKLFYCDPFDMLRIDTSVFLHRLDIDSTMKFVSLRKHEVGGEKRASIDEEELKLRSASFITKVK